MFFQLLFLIIKVLYIWHSIYKVIYKEAGEKKEAGRKITHPELFCIAILVDFFLLNYINTY